MKTLTLSEIIGQTIDSVRWTYNPKNEWDLQEFYSVIKLSNGVIIGFPIYDDEEYLILREQNIRDYEKSYNAGKELSKGCKEVVEGKQIQDFYFCYYEGKIDIDKRAYIKLSNGYYITEINFGPPGITVDLLALTENEFLNRVQRLKENLKSYLRDIKNAR